MCTAILDTVPIQDSLVITNPAGGTSEVPAILKVQVATDLAGSTHWVGLTNLTLTNATQPWIDPRAMTLPQRYYRVVPGPISVP